MSCITCKHFNPWIWLHCDLFEEIIHPDDECFMYTKQEDKK